jgi:hypothetical protein
MRAAKHGLGRRLARRGAARSDWRPPDALGLVFNRLPRGEQAFTVGLVSRSWRAWAALRRVALADAPPWLVRAAWPTLDATQRHAALARPSREGCMELLQLARQEGCPLGKRSAGRRRAAATWRCCGGRASRAAPGTLGRAGRRPRGGHLEVLRWARQQGCPWGALTCSAAARGHLAVLQWARQQGCPWGETTCSEAALGGHLEVLQWAQQQGCPWGETTLSEAALGGHLEVLQWARQQGCPWDQRVSAGAARSGHWELLQWAAQHGCPWRGRKVAD